ncbi:MAG: tRNA pseudouridine(13) synthase TruD [Planctomycetaceae bacterium]|mgnify:CR=1 FL=1|jgi:tRNA pseudouridine13 synthase|nr:tRNA pseudouridine(13) synthase TruD [Planctomycetaceae bacterium]MBT6487270.1 tRNA pseudouridine(13) synthase TruD [Planctomycetaceae bacterium]MBT6497613.1 tRNA pseudouridine(13) synthase TruD [Planctomycetaceae bacterium]
MQSTDTTETGQPEFLHECPLLTADILGVGGRIKQQPEDFIVEEIPAYEPSGEGEHLFLWIEKRDTAAEQLQRHLARAFGISSRDIGTAGLKDRRAVTRQFVSVPAACADRIGEVDTENIHVLRHALHGNKLRTGHSRGNRFSIRIRDVSDDATELAEAVRLRILESGFPNDFGSQRFGIDNETLALGLALLKGSKRPKDIPGSRRRFLLKFALSAAQSYLFNRALADRLNDGLIDQVLAGDVMQVVASGGPFVVEDVEREQGRLNQRETAITGPMFGPKMRSPVDEPAERELRVLEACGISESDFVRHRKLTPGTRRPFVVFPDDLTVSAEQNTLLLEFALPRGAYATSLLREFQEGEAKFDPN